MPVLPFPIGRPLLVGHPELRWTDDYARFFLSLNTTVNGSSGTVTTSSVKGTTLQINVAAAVGGVVLSLDPNVPLDNTANTFQQANTFSLVGPAVILPNATYTPTFQAAQWNILTAGSTKTNATNETPRTAIWGFFDTNLTNTNTAVITLDQIMTSNPGGGGITRTGIHLKHYMLPDNGGDTSALLAVSTGGGNAITAYKAYQLRPTGFTDYSAQAGYAIECGTTGGSYAVLVLPGAFSSTSTGGGVFVNIQNTTSKGFLASGAGIGLDGRIAYACGLPVIGGPDVGLTFSVTLSGIVTGVELIALGVGQATSTPSTSSGLGGAVLCQDNGAAANNGGLLLVGSNQGFFAGIKGLLTSGANNTTGHLSISTRNVNTDATLTERIRITDVGVVSLKTGQLQFPATQNPSSDAHTLDDYAEGTWTPADGSGAGLILTVTSANYAKVGRLVWVQCDIQYPATADGSNATISGLPVTSAAFLQGILLFRGGASGNGCLISASTTALKLTAGFGASFLTNAGASGAVFSFIGVYLSAS